ncbi:UPF0496 protein At1g20180 [Rutidosis leptorrhynchoides]|uniref:UPF0496 protein At1g20180 n=1 Tax=Rutidosis leptorrhynchoides TaxID=125765 RepID=UPI003A999164
MKSISPTRLSGKHDKHSTGSFVKETDVNEEYKKAFRTQSYTDICNKVQTHIRFDDTSSSSSIHDLHDILFEPQSETITNLANTFNLHHLIIDFFEAGLEAWKICEQLLESIHQVNANHRKVKHIIKLAQRVPQGTQLPKTYQEVASYLSSRNPLSDFGPEKFPKYTQHKLLLKKLTTKYIRIKRKQKIIKILKKSGACALMSLYLVLAIALMVLVCDGLVMAAASPGLFGFIKKKNLAKKRVKTRELKRVCAQLDVAAKGVYTMIKDLDTMGSLVGRLNNEIEFGRAMARRYVRNQKSDVLEEIMKEFKVHESTFMEQLEELEDHIYLCLLNVNRSRRLLVDEIMPKSQD